jgi:hypothetical protein
MATTARAEAAPSWRPIPSLPTLPLDDLAAALTPRLGSRPSGRFPLDAPNRQLFYLARAAVAHAVRHVLDGGTGTVLMPDYHHGVEVEAVRAAGATIDFYRIDATLTMDLEDVARRAAQSGVRALYVTHFIGFPQPIEEARALAEEQGLALIEDCALALFSGTAAGAPLGSFGDAAIFCLYKSLPVPHGGLLVAPDVAPLPTTRSPFWATAHHLAGLALAHLERWSPDEARLVGWLKQLSAPLRGPLVDVGRTGTSRLLQSELTRGATPLLPRLLDGVDPVTVVSRRRRNFRRLAEALDGCGPILGAPLGPSVCPLFLPLLVENKRRLVVELRAQGIEAIDFWSEGDGSCPVSPEVLLLRRHLLELPCHQSLDDDDIDRIAARVRELLRRG